MTLINFMMNSIPIFFLAFMKIPSKVWKQIVRLQRRFLWGGSNGTLKISWVGWLEACKPKTEGDLRIRDLSLVNMALLGKW